MYSINLQNLGQNDLCIKKVLNKVSYKFKNYSLFHANFCFTAPYVAISRAQRIIRSNINMRKKVAERDAAYGFP